MKLIIGLLLLFLVGCSSTNKSVDGLPEMYNGSKLTERAKDVGSPLSLEAANKLDSSLEINYDKDTPDPDDIAAEMRIKAISIDAYSWGIQEGVYYRTGVIQGLLEQNTNVIHKLISLGKFVVDGKMLMPTVIEAERIYVKNSDISSTEINMSYSLDKKPRIVSQVPTWRDYLKRTVDAPEEPLKHALPRNKSEKIAWDKEFKRGWKSGVKQANTIYNNDLARMHSDIAGLYRYRYLLSQNIVVLPVITNVKTGVIVLDSGNTIYLNNVEHVIEMETMFSDVNVWKPVFYQGDAHE
ncbi:MAG: defect-in-organelle-trafficking protein DotC [Colwellia sp.]|jgi:defect-in-organelle-trafficking protein DotC